MKGREGEVEKIKDKSKKIKVRSKYVDIPLFTK